MAEKYDAVERDVGICTYLTPSQQGFAAVLKARYADFVVHEGELMQKECHYKNDC